MKYKLINQVNANYNSIEQILVNRGIKITDIEHYLNTTDKDINEPIAFGEERMKSAATALINTIYKDEEAVVIVDCDCDGFTSSAILINYLHDLFPSWVENKLKWYIHEDKQHGLADCTEYIIGKLFPLVIVPDAGSNDYTYHETIANMGSKVIVLDHHEAEALSENAIVINNQLSDYPNKDLSGAGVTWQFCRFLDKLLNKNNADEYLDLVALGNMADMMSLKSIETKHLILKGFRKENIKNPFIYYMADKNSYSLGDKITPMGAAFYIAPFVNAMVRSGTLEEQKLLFDSMLKHKAFNMILSNKRGHKLGEMEKLVEQAVRTATNVKNRQTRAQDAAMELLEGRIAEENMMEHKVLLFLIKPGLVDKNIAGLCANKIMAKYQRPCCILTETEEIIPGIIHPTFPPRPATRKVYQGSARGYDKSGITNFKDICEQTGVVEYAEGHQGAFGLGIAAENIDKFIAATDEALKDMSSEPVYYVDYIYDGVDVKSDDILGIASLADLWGKDVDESFIAIENLKVTKEMVTLMSPDKKPTLKITLPNKVCLIKFGSNQEEYESFITDGYIAIDIVGRCNANTWNGWTTAQVMIEDYEIVGQSNYCF